MQSYLTELLLPYHLMLQLSGTTTSWPIWNTSGALKLWEDFWNATSWNLNLPIACWATIFLAIFAIFMLVLFGNFTMISNNSAIRCKNFHFMLEKMGDFHVSDFTKGDQVTKTFTRLFLGFILHLPLSFRIPATKYVN